MTNSWKRISHLCLILGIASFIINLYLPSYSIVVQIEDNIISLWLLLGAVFFLSFLITEYLAFSSKSEMQKSYSIYKFFFILTKLMIVLLLLDVLLFIIDSIDFNQFFILLFTSVIGLFIFGLFENYYERKYKEES